MSVLDLLSQHMLCLELLVEMRMARDSLMEAVCPLGDDTTVETIDANGVPVEVRAASPRRDP